MTTLHAIVRCFCNGYDEWETVEEIYQTLEDAEYRILELEDAITDEDVSYYIKEYKLK